MPTKIRMQRLRRREADRRWRAKLALRRAEAAAGECIDRIENPGPSISSLLEMAQESAQIAISVKQEESDTDDDVVELKPPIGNNSMSLRSRDRSIDQSGIESVQSDRSSINPDGIEAAIGANPNANSVSYIPAALHEFYRRASSINNKGDFTCALCAKPLKCRSARDMRDHALSHGGAHWASAFRCLLCSYHSHSRRSVSKHITSSHLIPDGVQCLPGELMENETITRQDELMALVRDCFPLLSQRNQARKNQRPSLGVSPANEMLNQLENGRGNQQLPVETAEPMRNTLQLGVYESQGQPMEFMPYRVEKEYEEGGGRGNWPNDVGNENENGCHLASPQEGPGVLEGWTVVDDGPESDKSINDANDSSECAAGASNHFPTYQLDSTSSPSGAAARAPVLQGLLRDFQFHPKSYAVEFSRASQAVMGNPSSCVSSVAVERNDDPRALIERLLNVVAPDVARFLLEEAIQARAVAASGHCGGLRVPIIEKVTASAPSSIISRMPAQRTLPKAVRAETKTAQVVTNRLKSEHRLGKLGVFKCNECNALFKRRRYLERHVRARHRLHCYRCTMYGCPFTNARELWYVRRHHAKHHANETELVCRFCCKRFPNSDELTSRHHACCSLAPRNPTESSASTSKISPVGEQISVVGEIHIT